MIHTKKVNSSVTALLLIMGLLLGYQSAHARTMRVAATAALSVCGGATSLIMGLVFVATMQENHVSLLERCQVGCEILAGAFSLYDAIEIVRGRNEHIQRKGSLVWTTTRMIVSLMTLYKLVPCIFDNNEKDSSESAIEDFLFYLVVRTGTICGIYSLCKSFQESKQLCTQYINLNKDVQHDIYKES